MVAVGSRFEGQFVFTLYVEVTCAVCGNKSLRLQADWKSTVTVPEVKVTAKETAGTANTPAFTISQPPTNAQLFEQARERGTAKDLDTSQFMQ